MFTVPALRVNWAARISFLYRFASLPLMYRQQSEPHEPVARAACVGTSEPVHIQTSHDREPEHEHEYSGRSILQASR
jgi:hypothetical protein